MTWDAKLVRTEGAIDETARQLHVIAQIDDPFGPGSEGKAPIKIGQYVTARLDGKLVPGALVIPNNTIYQGSYVYIVVDGILARRDIDIAWQDDKEAIVAAGLKPGDALVSTPLGQVTSGIRVSVVGEEPRRPQMGGPQMGGPQMGRPRTGMGTGEAPQQPPTGMGADT
jgi:multidrug efflux pump subunit AcrA (membrane-fusion protein)